MAASANGTVNVDCPMSLDFNPYNVSSFPKTAIPAYTIVGTITGLVALPTFYINLLVILTLAEDERWRSTSYNLLLAVLSLCDLLVGLVVQPLFVGLNHCIIFQCSHICLLTTMEFISALLCGGWSLATMMIISLERYLAIEYPLFYRINIKTKNVMFLTVSVWLVVGIVLVIGRWQSNSSYKIRQLPVAFVITVCSVTIIFCLSKVFVTARRQRNAINVLAAAVQPMHNQKRKEYKRTLTLSIVVIASVGFYVPSLITKIIGVMKGKEWNDDFKYISQFIWITILHMQSLVNPLILSLRLSYIRQGVKKKLLCKFD